MTATAKQIAKEVMESAKPMGLGGQILASREKYWSEIDDKEKIERVRNLAKGQMKTIQRLEKELNRIKRHTHNEKGEAIIVETLGYGGGSEMPIERTLRPGEKQDEVYI